LSFFQHQRRSDFRYRNRARGTDLNTALATQAFFFVHRDGLLVLHLENAGGTDINALFVADAFVFVNFNPPSHCCITSLNLHYSAKYIRKGSGGKPAKKCGKGKAEG
jgi:hypothetical protein